ncbi:MAG TPA: transposase [Polyangiaceae bacterium]
MAHPRRILPSQTYLVTRRCYQRTFRLRPSAQTNLIFMYCLALAVQKTGVVVHAACVMSNHHHLVVTDERGLLPDFLRELHRLTAKAMNASQGQWENLWSAEHCSAVRLTTDDDVIDKIAYVAANPVAAGLVEQPEKWPGFIAWGKRNIRVERPAAYFSEEGVCASALHLEVTPPTPRDGVIQTAREWAARVGRSIEEKVREAHARLRKEGRRFLGRNGVLAASFIQRAQSREEKRGTIPTFAARLREIRDGLRRVERHFRARYRAALDRWRGGDRAVAFPLGTWGMRVFHAVAVESPLAI